MKIVRIAGNTVAEIIPESATPVEKWYNEEFAKHCVETPDEVQPNWYYDSETNTFSPTFPEMEPIIPEPTTEEILNTLLGVTADE